MNISEPAKLGIFISYSHANTAQKETLRYKLESTGKFEVRFDVGKERLAEDLYKEISKNVNWADVIVPIITPEWLASHECRDELVRAHERRRRIIPFRRADLTDDGPPRTPHYLTKHLHVKWDDKSIDTNINELIDRLECVRIERWKVDCHRSIRSLGDYVQEADLTPHWKAALSRRVVTGAQAQLKKILQDSECSFEISLDSTYLNLADPIFGSAESILAVCIAEISSFWTNPDFRQKATNYLGKQKDSAKSISRLFVFRNADEANTYKNVLQAHQLQYGMRPQSGVFFCSKESYQALLQQWDYVARPESLAQDFGILTFGEDSPPLHAILNLREFRFREFQPDDITEARNQLVIEQFVKFRLLKDGQFDQQTGVFRWSADFYEDPGAFANVLTTAFGNRGGRISHYVALRPNKDSLNFDGYLYGLAARFYSDRKLLRIVDVRVERRVSGLKPVDGRFEGVIQTLSSFDHLLRIDFETKEALAHYYAHQIHSLEREKLYICLNPAIEKDFVALKTLPPNDVKGRQQAFEAIEQTMQTAGFILRYDAVDEEPMSSIVKRPGVPFGELNR
jgi:hypothetical protein